MPDVSGICDRVVSSAVRNWTQLTNRNWDVVVIGAGPAGALAATLLARCGHSTLLVDKTIFPRAKVCGCCLSVQALNALALAGLKELPDSLGAMPLRSLRVFSKTTTSTKRGLEFGLPAGFSLSRELLDSSLVHEAITAGATFAHGIRAHVEGVREFAGRELVTTTLSPADDLTVLETDSDALQEVPIAIASRVVVAADGIGGTSLSGHAGCTADVASNSRVGAGAVSQNAPTFYEAGTIYMAYASGGYTGLVRLENGATDMAAAFDPRFLRRCGSVANAAEQILAEAGLPVPDDMDKLPWKGTVALTRQRRRVALDRVFIIGDAASYVEPFTGEGIAWALHSALAVVPMVSRAISGWQSIIGYEWEREHRRLIGKRQRPTKLLAELLRHQELAGVLGKLIDFAPPLSNVLVNLVCTTSD